MISPTRHLEGFLETPVRPTCLCGTMVAECQKILDAAATPEEVGYRGMFFRPDYPEILEDDDRERQMKNSVLYRLYAAQFEAIHGSPFPGFAPKGFSDMVRELISGLGIVHGDIRMVALVAGCEPVEGSLAGTYRHSRDLRYLLHGSLCRAGFDARLAGARTAQARFETFVSETMCRMLMKALV